MTQLSSKWQSRFFGIAEEVAQWSEYPGTKVGAVIVGSKKQVISLGYNGCPRGVEASEARLSNENKYFYVEHAERNSLYNALRNGSSVEGASIFTTHFPCADCSRAIIQSGIIKVFYDKKLTTEQWKSSNFASETMLSEAKIEIFSREP